jgi:hypothetical protein
MQIFTLRLYPVFTPYTSKTTLQAIRVILVFDSLKPRIIALKQSPLLGLFKQISLLKPRVSFCVFWILNILFMKKFWRKVKQTSLN